MGLDIHGAKFLFGEKSRGIEFGRTLTLGRQAIYMSERSYASFLESLGINATVSEYADDFFRGLGADPMIPMDASDYEGAGLVHDMNELIDDKYHSAFDTVIDGGTLEHVFNFPVAIQNCMQMVKDGGQLILMTPWHNYSGHGFYQFSPELIYNTLSSENGYKVERMLIVTEGNWYSVRNPSVLKQRVEISTKDPVLLFVTARRIGTGPIFSAWPQQSDYSAAWRNESELVTSSSRQKSLKSHLVRIIPGLESLQSSWRHLKRFRSLSPARNPGLVRLCPSRDVPGSIDRP